MARVPPPSPPPDLLALLARAAGALIEGSEDALSAAAGSVAGTFAHVPVPSSNIDSAAYDPDTQEMEIWFTKYRRLYRYYGVPADGWAAFWAAPSKGFYAKYVMPTLYEYEHVE
jgi:hypothetical protein